MAAIFWSTAGISPRETFCRLRCQARSFPSASVKEVVSSPAVTMDAMRRSSSGVPVTATLPCPMKAVRAKTGALTPVSVWPTVAASMPGTGSFVPV